MSRPTARPAGSPTSRRCTRRRSRSGLDRVRAVHARLDAPIACPVVTVARHQRQGLDLRDAGGDAARAPATASGLYTSPHLLRYNERVRIDGARRERRRAGRRVRRGRGRAPRERPAGAAHLFRVRHARRAVAVRAREPRRAGPRSRARRAARRRQHRRRRRRGRHQRRPRPRRLSRARRARTIGREKAGIFRAGRPAICGDRDPPRRRWSTHARAIGAQLCSRRPRLRLRRRRRRNGATAARAASASACRCRRCAARYQLANAATALAALDLLRDRLPVSARRGARRAARASSCRAASRCCRGGPTIVLDVAHNPHAARALADALGDDGLSIRETHRGVRHARRQGHRAA